MQFNFQHHSSLMTRICQTTPFPKSLSTAYLKYESAPELNSTSLPIILKYGDSPDVASSIKKYSYTNCKKL